MAEGPMPDGHVGQPPWIVPVTLALMASTPVAFILAGGIVVGTKDQNERLRTRSTRASGFLPALAAVPCIAQALSGSPVLWLVAFALLGVAVYLVRP